MTETILKTVIGGGEFLIKDSLPEDIFMPEEMTEDQAMARSVAKDFLANDIQPNREKIEKQQDNISVKLIERMGELGLLGTQIPEEYGGSGMDTNTNTFFSEDLGTMGSMGVTYAAHTGIGMLPILYFGTEKQKHQYLPRLISGELKAAYCLTEPSSGSDALAAKTRADLDPSGQFYLMNGQKMWISNAGFADIFIVFAKIGGTQFTGFIVERNTPGLTLGAEEAKLGIKGSSTRQVFFENVKVPAENLLGEAGKGHLIAFNALNTGRFKIGPMSVGGSKVITTMSIQYANERIQFKVPIATFGAIQYKIAEQTIRNFAVESSVFRVSQLMQDKIHALREQGATYGDAALHAAEEYAIECSLLKIAGSEMLDYVVDENLQIHGGMGYSEELPAARAYRDSRINRIYEGTNEINRLLAVDQLLKRAMKGALDLVGPAWAVQKELASMPSMDKPQGLYAEEKAAVKDFKKIILMVAGGAVKMQMDGKLDLRNEQEILMNVADMLLDLLNAESTLLRVEKLHARTEKPAPQEVYDALLKTLITDASARIQKNASDALASFAEGDLLRTFLMGLKRFNKYAPANVRNTRRLVAQFQLGKNEYAL